MQRAHECAQRARAEKNLRVVLQQQVQGPLRTLAQRRTLSVVAALQCQGRVQVRGFELDLRSAAITTANDR